ncbi:TonB-dependent receptor [Bacteroidota bacterium]
MLHIFISNIFCQDSNKVYQLGEVIVKAKLPASTYLTIPYTSDKISLQTLENFALKPVFKSIGEISPGIFVTQRTSLGFGIGPGSAGDVTIRGIGGSPNTQILVLIDGNPQYMGLMGHPLSDVYSTDKIEEIHVIKGPASAIYGSNAFGGVIDLKTRKPKNNGLNLALKSFIGSFNTQKYHIGSTYKSEKLSLLFSFRREHSDGHRKNSEFELNNWNLNSEYILNDKVSLSAAFVLDDYSVYDPGTEESPKIDNWADVLRGNSTITLKNWFTTLGGELNLFYNFGEHEIYDGFRSSDNNIGIRLYQNFSLFNGNVISVGIDHKAYGGKAKNRESGISFGRHYLNELAGYINFNQDLIDDLSMNAALRIENNSKFGNIFVPQMGVIYSVGQLTRLKILISKGFRNPTIRELYLFPFPSPNLIPESVWNYEVSISTSVLNSVDFNFTTYYLEGENIIQVEGVPPNLTYSNSGDLINKGFESALQWSLYDNLRLNISYSFIDPDKITMGFPQNKLNVSSNLKIDNLDVQISLQYNKKIYGGNNFINRLSDFTLLSFKSSYKIIKQLLVYFSGENILDRDYRIINGYPMPGISLEFGASYKFSIN